MARRGVAKGKKRAHDQGLSMVLIDESGFMLQPVVRRTWAPKGKTPIQYSWDRHDRLSVISAITLSPVRQQLGLCFQIHNHNVTSVEVMAFLTMIHRRLRRKFILVLDRLNAHRKAVRLLQAARRVRLAEQTVLIRNGELERSLRPEVFDLAAVAAESAEKFKSLCAATGVILKANLPDGQVRTNADPGRIGLVLRDLLEVCLAMTAAGGTVSLEMTVADREAEIVVTDSGMGMSREELESLFSTTGSAPVHESYTGGIRDGLFVAKEIVEASGGQLWAESASGKGTRFNVRMPLA